MQMPGLVREINSAIIVCGANLLVSCSVGVLCGQYGVWRLGSCE